MRGSFINSKVSVRNLTTIVMMSFFLGGCSLFFGNIKPIDEKSSTYHIVDLSKEDPDWVRVDSGLKTDSSSSKESTDSGLSDVAYQSQTTSSVISINSACKSYLNTDDNKEDNKNDESKTGQNGGKNLKELTRELLLGFSDTSLPEERTLTLDGTPALQTTLRGMLNQESVVIRTVVLQRENCVYDLMYVSRPKSFKTNEDVFSRFVSSLRLMTP